MKIVWKVLFPPNFLENSPRLYYAFLLIAWNWGFQLPEKPSFLCDGPEWITEGSSYYLCRAFRMTSPSWEGNFAPSIDFLWTYIKPFTALLPTSVLQG